MLDRLGQRLPKAVLQDLADGMATLPAWATPIAREITTPPSYGFMNKSFESFLMRPDQERRDIFDAAEHMDTLATRTAFSCFSVMERSNHVAIKS